MKKLLFISALTVATLALGIPASRAFEETDPLPDRVADPGPEAPVLDTALVFTNVGSRPSHAEFAAFDDSGREVAAGEIDIPAGGLVYVLASRIAHAGEVRSFVGHVRAKATGRVHGRTVVLGALGTDIDTINVVKRRRASTDEGEAEPETPLLVSQITFPVVATR